MEEATIPRASAMECLGKAVRALAGLALFGPRDPVDKQPHKPITV
jgi:hypothetical protein